MYDLRIMDFLFPRRHNVDSASPRPSSFAPSWLQPMPMLLLFSMLDDENQDNCRRFLFNDGIEVDDDERSIDGHVFRHLFTPAPVDGFERAQEEQVLMNQQ